VAGPPDGASGPERLEVGRIGRAHGLRGEVAVTASSNRDERFTPGSVLFVEEAGGERELVVVSSRPHQGRWLVHFDGITDRTSAEALHVARLSGVPLGPLGDDEVWVHEVVGAEVWHGDQLAGRVVAVEANPASDLLVLDSGALVPMVFVTATSPGRVEVEVPAGLFD
jgi:16S rRNA processing protein RimM